jgi:ribonuclease I
MVAAIKINNDGYGNGSLCRSDGYDKKNKKQSVHGLWPEVFIKGYEIQVHTIEDQFNAHEHGDEVPSGQKAINTREKEYGADQ